MAGERSCQGNHRLPRGRGAVAGSRVSKETGRKAIPAFVNHARVNGPAVLRVTMIVISLVATAMGSGAADDRGGRGGWVPRR